jgi:hypothetical protein
VSGPRRSLAGTVDLPVLARRLLAKEQAETSGVPPVTSPAKSGG